MNFDFGFNLPGNGMMAASILAVYLIILLVVSMFGIVSYIFRSMGLFAIAKRRGVENCGLAWVPVIQVWTAGCIADDYEAKENGKETRYRHWVLWLMIGSTFLYAVAAAFIAVSAVVGIVAPMIVGVFAVVFASGAMIAWSVFNYIVLYKIYKSCLPDYAVMFTVLSVLFGAAEPFFIFALRNKDEGMAEGEPDIEVEYVIYDAPVNEKQEKPEPETEPESPKENEE